MAANRDIVATRKLNKKNKARLGRGGDTRIRKVDGRDSHVNALEAYLIDVNKKAGERYAKRVGAGTTNPLTGMPEYHPAGSTWDSAGNMKFEAHDDSQHTHENTPSGDYEYGWDYGNEIPNITDPNTGGAWMAPTGRQTYETLSDYTPEQLETYLQSEFGMGGDSMQYIEGFKQEPFGFLGEQQDISEAGATFTRDIDQRELGDVRTDTLSGLKNLRTDTLSGLKTGYADTMGAFGSQQATLGRQMGRGFGQAAQSAGQATKRSNMAFSGTITQGLESQQKQLFQDYSAGMKDIQRGMQSATRDLGLGTARAERDYTRGTGIAERDYTQGMGDTTSAYDLAIRGADLDFRQAEYLEKQRQLDELYADVGAIPT